MEIFALTTRGLEALSAHEIAGLSEAAVSGIAYRRVQAIWPDSHSPLPLLSLRTVDDVFLEIARWSGIARPRASLELLRSLSYGLDLQPAAAVCASVRPLRTPPIFSVTASFVGRRNYSTDEIKQALTDGIRTGHGWLYTADDAAADLNVRIFIEQEFAIVGVRLGKRPLHERPYKQVHRPGSLKPPVAAGLALLAGADPARRVLDPCCGVGTIVIEAARMGAAVQGGDISSETIGAAQANARAADLDLLLKRWDAQALPLPDASIDSVVSNLPWGRQIVVDASLVSFYRRAAREMQRVLAPGGRLVLLTNVPELLDRIELERVASIEISLFGQNPTIMVFEAHQPGRMTQLRLPGAEYDPRLSRH